MKLKKRKSLCAQCVNMPAKVSKKVVGMIIRSRKSIMKDGVITVPMIFVKSHSLTPLTIIISQLPLPLFPVAAPNSTPKSRPLLSCYLADTLSHSDIRSIPVSCLSVCLSICLSTLLLSRVPFYLHVISHDWY